VLEDLALREQRAEIVLGQDADLLDLVRGPEAVEEVEERNARLERGGGTP
jgi:hypothetical protein